MEMIGLFVPAMFSVWIKHKRNTELTWSMPKIVFEYGIYVFVNVFITTCIITYALGISGVTSDALTSFPFFTKYTLIASVMAILVPYVEEIVSKYFKVTLTVRPKVEKSH